MPEGAAIVRALHREDLPAIKELDGAAFSAEEQYSRVAVAAGWVVGYAYVQMEPQVRVRSLAVHPAYRRRGYATALLRDVIGDGAREVAPLKSSARFKHSHRWRPL